ncbi:hypothetical protein DO259_21905 [Salmonella enterica]|nr:hypothetical protein [Salmonella enterica]ECD5006008.1 hypothetical protein [Salmonella enterica subsp. enterica serovar Curacao]EDR5661767.1 hypothetical protein [Salmonella enterica]EDV1152606.1 hypothetical protein [Salmonella enterica subsp. enterica]
MCVYNLKQCYGCGMPLRFNGFQSIPDVPMCSSCRDKGIKPRYVYVYSANKILPKYEYSTEIMRSKTNI